MTRLATLLTTAAGLWLTAPTFWAGEPKKSEAVWPQFRGPGGAGLAREGMKLPTQIGPAKNVVWKTALPPGHSSPCVWGDRIFLTGFDKKTKKLETLCLDREKGQILWRQTVPAKKLEKIDKSNSPAASTPATDGKRVYVYFGSYGLLCYNFAGKEQWKKPLAASNVRFGSGTSPALAGDLLLVKTQGGASSLLALDPRTGDQVWKKSLPFDAGYSLPALWQQGKTTEVVVHGSGGIRAYDLKTGAERWSMSGFFAAAIPTPVAAEGLLFVVSQFAGGDQDDRLKLPDFDELLKKYDKDKDGKLSRAEIPKGLVLYSRGGHRGVGDIKLLDLFSAFDLNGDGKIDRQEWTRVGMFVGLLDNAFLAIRPGGKGDVTKTHVAWKEKRSLPEVPSPLCYQGRLYLVKHGGIVTCLRAKTGKLVYRKRLGSSGLYYSSPVAGDGKVYLSSVEGKVIVLKAGDEFKVLARSDFGEPITATPALVDGKIYLRTQRHLYAFGDGK
jgi:outer membrane protein assembly factor BamB